MQIRIDLRWLKDEIEDAIEEMRGIYPFADEDASITITGGYPVPYIDTTVIIRTKNKETGIDISLEKGILLSDGEERK